MVFGENFTKINGSKLAINPLRTVQGAILGYNSLIKRIRLPKIVPSKSVKNREKS